MIRARQRLLGQWPVPWIACAAALVVGCTGAATRDGGSDVALDDRGDGALDGPEMRDVVPRDRVALPEGGDVDGSSDGAVDGAVDAALDGADGGRSRIEHVVIISQENHSFDVYFGRYCTAPAGSNPTCTDGPACCEGVPDREPSGATPVDLTDTQNGAFDPDHSFACELAQVNGGRMDRFVTGTPCSDRRTFAVAPNDLVQSYHRYAREGALADRYFQPIIGSTSANDMYFAVARFVFRDNEFKPNSVGQGCINPLSRTVQYTGQTTIADVLLNAGFTFRFYHEGYDRMRASATCPRPPSDCRSILWPLSPCNYDPSDNPFQYYRQFTDNPTYTRDVNDLMGDLAGGRLANVTFVKFASYHNEHPGFGTYISDGIAQVDRVVNAVLASPYASRTLILITWDEGGGFFDHVPPPPPSTVDMEPYGTRIPLIAVGRFARRNYVSHVVMEHSSIVRFLEFNFLGRTGQLGNRDAVVNNIGSMLEPAEVGLVVP